MNELFVIEDLLSEEALNQIENLYGGINLDDTINIDNIESFEESTFHKWFVRPIDWNVGIDLKRIRTTKDHVPLAIQTIENKAYDLIGVRFKSSSISILRYGLNAGIGLHTDGLGDKFTCVVMLNNDYDNGEFVIKGKMMKAKRGDCVIFNSSMFHSVEKVTRGNRMVLAVYLTPM